MTGDAAQKKTETGNCSLGRGSGGCLVHDMDGLAAVLADDLIDVQTAGIVDGKAALLPHAGGFFHLGEVERGLPIRSLGPVRR